MKEKYEALKMEVLSFESEIGTEELIQTSQTPDVDDRPSPYAG